MSSYFKGQCLAPRQPSALDAALLGHAEAFTEQQQVYMWVGFSLWTGV